MPDLQRELGWSAAGAGTLTSALQLGFIVGALVLGSASAHALHALSDALPLANADAGRGTGLAREFCYKNSSFNRIYYAGLRPKTLL